MALSSRCARPAIVSQVETLSMILVKNVVAHGFEYPQLTTACHRVECGPRSAQDWIGFCDEEGLRASRLPDAKFGTEPVELL